MSDPLVAASGVTKTLGDSGVLDGADVTVEDGEVLVVMGENGAGKSVLLSCLAGSDTPTEGTVEVMGAPASAQSDTTSLLLQDALCVDRLTGRENVDFYRRLHPDFGDDWREHVERLGIAGDLHRPVEEYSGGMKRKLELAVALSVDVPLYVMDEPTAALDLSAVQTVHRLFREKRRAGKTIVVASHLPMDADVADRVAFLADGRVTAEGAPGELFDAVPPLLETTLEGADALADRVPDDRLFAVDGGVRAFLPDAASPPTADAAPGGGSAVPDGVDAERVDPTYTDLFNYYTTVAPATEGNRD